MAGIVLCATGAGGLSGSSATARGLPEFNRAFNFVSLVRKTVCYRP